MAEPVPANLENQHNNNDIPPMLSVAEFKQQYNLEARKNMVSKRTAGRKQPGDFKNLKAIFVYNITRTRTEPIPLKNQKFITPSQITMGHFINVIRRQMVNPMHSKRSIFLVYDPLSCYGADHNNNDVEGSRQWNGSTKPVVFSVSWTVGDVYRMYHCPEDQFLYLGIMQEDTFGTIDDDDPSPRIVGHDHNSLIQSCESL